MTRKILILLLFITSATLVKAGGYQVNAMGIKQNGMGYIGTGFSLDASSVFFNPGAMSMMDQKYSFTGGIAGIFSNVTFQKASPSTYQARTDSKAGTPFNFYGAAKINDKLAVGIGVFTPFGNSLNWGSTWDGRYLITDLSFHVIDIQPTVSYKINKMISIGAGFNYLTGSVELNKALPVTNGTTEGTANLTGNTTSYGFTAGVMLQPTEKLGIGIMFRSRVEMKMDGGDAKFTVPASLATNFPNTTFDAMLPLPSNLNIGFSYKVSEKLMLGLDLNIVYWSTYDSLNFDFSKTTSALQNSHNPRLYKNTIAVRLGGQYKLNDKLTLRGGAYYDPSPITADCFNPETPSLNQLGLTLGATYKFSSKFSADASVGYLYGFQRDCSYPAANFSGTYKSEIILPGIGLSYNF